MKQSLFTGQYIYNQIKETLDELQEFDIALTELESYDNESPAYKYLVERRKMLQDRLNDLFRREYK